MSVAVLTTSHFTFHAVGVTADEARAALLQAWQRHADQTGADRNYIGAGDIQVLTGPAGTVFRDGSPI